MHLRGRHYATGQKVDVVVENREIQSVAPAGLTQPDFEADWIAPGIFDLQINGCDGISFNSPELNVEQIHQVVSTCHHHGITALCPTLVTNSGEALIHGFRTLANACAQDRDLNRVLPAFHLEGPYISAEDGPRGAHPKQHVRRPVWDEFRRWQDAAGGRIRLVTLAPEIEGALHFIEKLVQSGVVVSLGHTGATPAIIRDAIRAGAKLSTHLGNGCHAMLPRHENYLWEQLAADELSASIISDGHHLPPALVRCILRVKSPERTILTCDASPLAGLPVGKYRLWDAEFEVQKGGKVVVPGTPYLAGSGVFTDVCIGNVIRFAGVTLADAVDMASIRPRQLLGLPPIRLEPSMSANLILFDWQPGEELHVQKTLSG